MTRSAEILQGDESGGGYGSGLFERDVVRLQRQLVVSDGHVFGICATGGPSMGDSIERGPGRSTPGNIPLAVTAELINEAVQLGLNGTSQQHHTIPHT